MSAISDNRLAAKAAIKRASAAARRDMTRLDADTLGRLTDLYKTAVETLRQDVDNYAGQDGSVRLEVLQDLLAQAQRRLAQLEKARNDLLNTGMQQAAQIGVDPFAADAVLLKTGLTQIANDAAQFAVHFVHEDGLQLSDRIWRVDNHARQVVADAIQQAVIQGHSASRAAQDFLARGLAVPKDVADKLNAAQAAGIGKAIGEGILHAEGSPHANALRLFRTELNRAHGEAYQAAAFEHPDVVGTRFLLSPGHPRPDICDMHARVNRYGLGPGVYPKGKNPWPAHPNTLSYTEVVFADEVTAEDSAGKQDRVAWLNAQAPHIQEGVVGGRMKRAVLDNGLLKENQIATPWRVLKGRLESAGVNIEALTQKVTAGAGPSPLMRDQAIQYVVEQGLATGFEHAVAFDGGRRVEFFRKTSRRVSRVKIDRYEMTILANPAHTITLVHNHPASSSLSLADFKIGAQRGVKTVVAAGHDGAVYEAEVLKGVPEIERLHDIATDVAFRAIRPLIDKQKITPDEADRLHWHAVNSCLDRVGAIRYRADLTKGATGRLVEKFATLIDDIVEAMPDGRI